MFQTFHLNRLRVFFCGAHAKQTVLFECGGIRPALLHLEYKEEKSYGGRQFLPAKIWVSLPYNVMNKFIILFLIIILLFSASCINEDKEKIEEYNKCNSVCASVLSDDFVTLELCRRECEEKFLKEE